MSEAYRKAQQYMNQRATLWAEGIASMGDAKRCKFRIECIGGWWMVSYGVWLCTASSWQAAIHWLEDNYARLTYKQGQ